MRQNNLDPEKPTPILKSPSIILVLMLMLLLVTSLIVISVVEYIYHHQGLHFTNFQQVTQVFPRNISSNSSITIVGLEFYDIFSHNINEFPVGPRQCGSNTCTFYNDIADISKADAVIVNVWRRNLPLSQVCGDNKRINILYVNESPARKAISFWEKFNGCFHLTSTYSEHSDLPSPYLRGYQRRTTDEIATVNISSYLQLTNKTLPIAWVVSHCNTHSRREVYVNRLQTYINVDVYGRCGSMSCPETDDGTCWTSLEYKYYFYLAFENSICPEYLTEKTVRTLNYWMIPIVMAGTNNSKILPPGSFINALDFKSPKDLADYLYAVMNNRTLYQSYFEWKKDYSLAGEGLMDVVCQSCQYLHKLMHSTTSLAPITTFQDMWNRDKCTRVAWEDGIFYPSLFHL